MAIGPSIEQVINKVHRQSRRGDLVDEEDSSSVVENTENRGGHPGS